MRQNPSGTIGPPLRLLVINPNTNPAVTDRVRRAAEEIISPGTAVMVVNPDAGPFSIESAEDRSAAEGYVRSLIEASAPRQFDGYVLACFDDIAVDAARSMLDAPVVSSCEAGISAARSMSRRFAVVTTVHSAVPTICGLLERYGASEMASVRAAGIGVAAAAGTDSAADARIGEAIRTAIAEDGAEAILLGSGGLTGRAGTLSRLFSIPVIDAVSAAIKMAEGFAALRACQTDGARRN